jgi:diguanylate cyclase
MANIKLRPLRLVKPAAATKTETVGASHAGSPASAADYYYAAAGVGDYYERIARFAQKIRQTNDVNRIISILDEALLETRALHTHDELRTAREQVERAEQRIESLKNELERVNGLVHADPLTGAFNRGGLDAAYKREAARADRHNTPLCVALLDLDDFKRLNDTCGHMAGDNALQLLVNIARETLRPLDTIARYGGEEFVILLPETGMDKGIPVIYRLQRNLAKGCLLHTGHSTPITFSAGVTLRGPQENQSMVIDRADKALYMAKHAGKNRVVAARS